MIKRITTFEDALKYLPYFDKTIKEKYGFKRLKTLKNILYYITNHKLYNNDEIITEKNIGEILVSVDDNDKPIDFLLAFDLYYVFNNLTLKSYAKDIKYLFNCPEVKNEDIEEEIRLVKKGIYNITPTSLIIISSYYTVNDFKELAKGNSKKTFVDHELEKALENSYINYNLVYISEKLSDSLFLALRHDEKDKLRHFTPSHGTIFDYVSTNKYPNLICVFDDDRIKNAMIAVPKGFDIYSLTKTLGYQIKRGRTLDEINSDAKTKVLDEDGNEIEIDIIKKLFSTTVKGLATVYKDDNVLPYFYSNINESSEVDVYNVWFDVFYELERAINEFQVCEGIKYFDENKNFVNISDNLNGVSQSEDNQVLFFFTYLNKSIYYNPMKKVNFTGNNDASLNEIMDAFPREINSVTDVIATIPFKYDDINILHELASRDNNFIVNNILTGFKFQQNIEYGKNNQATRDFGSRIERIDLGSKNLILLEEIHYNYYKEEIMHYMHCNDIESRLIISVDKETSTAVLHIISFGMIVPTTKFIDMITSNNCFFNTTESTGLSCEEKYTYNDGSVIYKINLYDYLYEIYKLTKVGDPRFLITAHDINENNKLEEPTDIIPALLFSESLDENQGELGHFIDKDMIHKLDKPNGVSIYDYATIYTSRCTLLQCGSNYRDYIPERIDFEIVNLFYIELLMFEDAAVKIATKAITDFMNEYKIKGSFIDSIKNSTLFNPKYVLKDIDNILEEYAKTMDFWDTDMNYFSSRKIMKTLRLSFQIDADIRFYTRVSKEIATVYDNRKNDRDKITSALLAAASSLLTIKSFYDIIDEYDKWHNKWLDDFYAVYILLFFLGAFILFALFNFINRKVFKYFREKSKANKRISKIRNRKH